MTVHVRKYVYLDNDVHSSRGISAKRKKSKTDADWMENKPMSDISVWRWRVLSVKAQIMLVVVEEKNQKVEFGKGIELFVRLENRWGMWC
jgi:hypothetical protein